MAQKTIQVTADDALAYNQCVCVCPAMPKTVHVHFECADATKASTLNSQLQGQFGGLACDVPPPAPPAKLSAAHKKALTAAGVDTATQAKMEKCTGINWSNVIALLQKDGPTAVAIIQDILAAFGL